MTRSAILYPRSSILDLQSLVRADAGAKDRADGRSFTAAGDPANDRAEHASGDAASRGVLTPAAGFDVAFLVNGLDALALVDLHDLAGESAAATVAQPDRVEGQRQFCFTRSLARLIERGDVAFDDTFGEIARVEHDGRELVAFSIRLRADLRVKTDLHLNAIRNEGTFGESVIPVLIGIALNGRRGLVHRRILRGGRIRVDCGDDHSTQIRRKGDRERPSEESVVIPELEAGAVGLLEFRLCAHAGLVAAVGSVVSVAARKLARLALVEIALALREAVFITGAVAVLIGVAVSGRVIRNDLRPRLRGLRRRYDVRS